MTLEQMAVRPDLLFPSEGFAHLGIQHAVKYEDHKPLQNEYDVKNTWSNGMKERKEGEREGREHQIPAAS